MVKLLLLSVFLVALHYTTAELGFCANNPCQNGGVCKVVGPNQWCKCPSGWQGRSCQIPFSITPQVTTDDPCPTRECPTGDPAVCDGRQTGEYPWPGHPNGYLTCYNNTLGGWDCRCCPAMLFWNQKCQRCLRENEDCNIVVTTPTPPCQQTVTVRITVNSAFSADLVCYLSFADGFRTVPVWFNFQNGVNEINICIDGFNLGALTEIDIRFIRFGNTNSPFNVLAAVVILPGGAVINALPNPVGINSIRRVVGLLVVPRPTLPPPAPLLIWYKITICTGKPAGAGTMANAFIRIHRKGGPGQLDFALGNSFRRNSVVAVDVQGPPLGEICTIELWTDFTGASPNWFVQAVLIRDSASDGMYSFPLDRWITQNYRLGSTALSAPCEGCFDLAAFCTGKAVGNYCHPESKHDYITCGQGQNFERSCPLSLVWVESSPGVGLCNWDFQ